MTDRQPIHPRDLDGPPFCLLQMHDCIESWRGTPRREVPQEVKALAFMFDKLRDTMTRCEQMDRFVQAIEIEMKAEHVQAMRKIAAIRDQVCLVNLPLLEMQEAEQMNKAPPAKRQRATTHATATTTSR